MHSLGICLSGFCACILSRVLKCGILKLVSGCGWLVWPALISLLAPWIAAVVLFVVQLLDTILTLAMYILATYWPCTYFMLYPVCMCPLWLAPPLAGGSHCNMPSCSAATLFAAGSTGHACHRLHFLNCLFVQSALGAAGYFSVPLWRTARLLVASRPAG